MYVLIIMRGFSFILLFDGDFVLLLMMIRIGGGLLGLVSLYGNLGGIFGRLFKLEMISWVSRSIFRIQPLFSKSKPPPKAF